jgi:hypothetical protein
MIMSNNFNDETESEGCNWYISFGGWVGGGRNAGSVEEM